MSKATVAEPPSNANEGPAEPPARQSKPPPDPRAATIKAPTNRLARQSPNDNHARAAMPVSHPDRRCLPIQIAALQFIDVPRSGPFRKASRSEQTQCARQRPDHFRSRGFDDNTAAPA